MFTRYTVALTILSFLFCLSSTVSQQSEFVYYNRWKQVVPQNLIIDAHYEANNIQTCGVHPCSYYFYLYEDTNLRNEVNRNRTVLLLSGMEGNDSLGPEVLLASYGKLAAARIIYFPLANPSGYVRGTSVTFPQKFNPLDDFPIRGSMECNQTSAVRILRYLYLHYQIDLSIYIHGGKADIGYSWSQEYGHGSTVNEDGIYRSLSEMLKYYGNIQAHENGLEQMRSGTSGNIGDRAGKYVDWAYGASKYPHILSETCGGKSIKKQPEDRMNGLVLSIGLGQINNGQDDKRQNTIKRGLLLLKKIISIVNPQLVLTISGTEIDISIKGCKIGVLRNLTLSDSLGRVVLSQTQDMIINGDIVSETVGLTGIKTTIPMPMDTNLTFAGSFKCNNGWIGQGRTSFAKIYEYRSTGLLVAYRVLAESGRYFRSREVDYCLIAIVVFLFVLIVTRIAGGIRACIRLKRTRRLQQFGERFEHVQHVEDLYTVEDSFVPKGLSVSKTDSPRG